MQFHPSDKTPLLADAAVQATGSSGGALAGECTGERAGGQASRFVSCDWRGRPVQVEYQWLAPERQQTTLLVFLHEGLGSLSMWKDFPQRLCDAAQCRGLVYSRPGYGRSSSRAVDEVFCY